MYSVFIEIHLMLMLILAQSVVGQIYKNSGSLKKDQNTMWT